MSNVKKLCYLYRFKATINNGVHNPAESISADYTCETIPGGGVKITIPKRTKIDSDQRKKNIDPQHKKKQTTDRGVKTTLNRLCFSN